MIDENRKKNAERITGYWELLSFLNQENLGKFKDLSTTHFEKSDKRKSLRWVTVLNEKKDLNDALQEAEEKTGLPYHGKITVSFGKINRDDCAVLLAEKLNETEDLDREDIVSSGQVALMTMQLNPDGAYHLDSHTFSISPLLWITGRAVRNNCSPENLVSVPEYQNDVRKFEELLNPEKNEEDHNESSVSSTCVTYAQLQMIAGKVLEKCLPQGIHYQEFCVVSFTMYLDQKAAEQESEDFIPLGHDFFSESLEEVRDAIRQKSFGSHPMDQALIDYIDGPLRETKRQNNVERLDVVHPASFSAYQEYMDKILHILKSPLGKWPSRYQSSLMQQVAINEVSSLYENDQKNIFSVNGPPGTGKTTMLKQIVADYMVKRAKLLCEYRKPDDAFKKNFFKDGIMTFGGYDKNVDCYYTLKNDAINNYGILVASFNNNAVENITVEFTESKGIQNDLKTTEKDDPDTVTSLNEIRDLFDPDQSDETVAMANGKELTEKKDVYFSSYGTSLLHSEKVPEDSWGAISARLGNRKNVNEYCFDFLQPLFKGEFRQKNQDADDYGKKLTEWRQAVTKFQKQVDVVKGMRQEMKGYCNHMTLLHDTYNFLNDKLKVRKPEIEAKLEKLEKDREENQASLPSLEQEYNAADSKVSRLQKEALDPLKGIVDEKQKIYDTAFHEFDAVQKQYEKQETESKDLNYQIESSQVLIENLKEKFLHLHIETETLQNAVEDRERTVRKCQNDLLATEDQLNRRIAMMNQLMDELNGQNARREELMSLGFFARHNRTNQDQLEKTNEEIRRLKEVIREHENDLDQENQKHAQCSDALREAAVNLTNTRNRITECQEQIKKSIDGISRAKNDISAFQESLKQNQKQAEELLGNLNEKGKPLVDAEEDLNAAKQNYEECLKEVNPYLEYRKETQASLQKARQAMENDTKEIEVLKEELAGLEKEKQKNLEEQRAIANQLKEKGIVVPDTDFLMRAISNDDHDSVMAQTADPWVSPAYDREREKLFRYALNVNKYFLSASSCAQANLRSFFAMQEGFYYGGQRVRFSQRDLQNCAGPLFQTVFLLTPVISTTFASAGKLLKYVNPHQLGLLMVDEAGQSEPQCALKTLLTCRKALIVGDPRQIEPVVSDDMRLLKKSFHGEIYDVYKNPGNSVQSNADLLNPVGTWSETTWTGSPLLVHRRCVSPMFEIANEISYDNAMKQQTSEPSLKKSTTFAGHGSRWYQICGHEERTGHGVPEQNRKAVELLEEAFARADEKGPDIFVISPFRSVVKSFKKYVISYMKYHLESPLYSRDNIEEWLDNNVGTIHTFQGKEADQVIFLLGCDRRTKTGTVTFVKKNIVNVAVTRARYRLFAIGDMEVWKDNPDVSAMIRHLYLYSWAKLRDLKEDDPEYKQKASELIESLPDEESFDITEETDPEGNPEYVIHPPVEQVMDDHFLAGLTDENLKEIGLNKQVVDGWNPSVKLGLRTYFTLKPVIEKAELKADELMAVEPGILFCLGLEAQLKDCLTEFLKESDPDMPVNLNHRDMTLSECDVNEMTIGTYSYVLRKGKKYLAWNAEKKGHPDFDDRWWNEFQTQLWQLTHYRNDCCHYQKDDESNETKFDWKRLQAMMKLLFVSGHSSQYDGLDTGIMQACDSVKEELG